MRLNPDTGAPLAGSSAPRGYGLHWRRRQGRAGLLKEVAPPLHRDEMLSRLMCIAGLRRVWFKLPKGGKRPLARELKLNLQQLRNAIRGRGGLPEACRRRISRFLMQHARGEIILTEISPHANAKALWRAHKPSHEWRRTTTTLDKEVANQWLKEVGTEAESVVFHAANERLFG